MSPPFILWRDGWGASVNPSYSEDTLVCAQKQHVNWILRKALSSHPLDANPFEKNFAMLSVYMDDSGSHDQSHNCVIAGYWGEVREWRRFEREWRAVLLKYGIEEFKANEFWPRLSGGRRNPPYNGWSDERSDAYINDLLTVIESRRVFPFANGILGDQWNQLLPHHKGILTYGAVDSDLQKALFMPLSMAVVRVLDYCREGRTMNFFFDDDPKNTRLTQAIVACFGQIKASFIEEGSSASEKIGSFGFEDSKVSPPIQAADLLAYEAHRWAKGAQGDQNSPTRMSYKRALSRAKTIEDFRFAASSAQKGLRRHRPETNCRSAGRGREHLAWCVNYIYTAVPAAPSPPA